MKETNNSGSIIEPTTRLDIAAAQLASVETVIAIAAISLVLVGVNISGVGGRLAFFLSVSNAIVLLIGLLMLGHGFLRVVIGTIKLPPREVDEVLSALQPFHDLVAEARTVYNHRPVYSFFSKTCSKTRPRAASLSQPPSDVSPTRCLQTKNCCNAGTLTRSSNALFL